MVEHSHWLELPYTRKLIIDLEKWQAKSLAELLVAVRASTDPIVRSLSATYEAHTKSLSEIKAKKAEGRENGD